MWICVSRITVCPRSCGKEGNEYSAANVQNLILFSVTSCRACSSSVRWSSLSLERSLISQSTAAVAAAATPSASAADAPFQYSRRCSLTYIPYYSRSAGRELPRFVHQRAAKARRPYTVQQSASIRERLFPLYLVENMEHRDVFGKFPEICLLITEASHCFPVNEHC